MTDKNQNDNVVRYLMSKDRRSLVGSIFFIFCLFLLQSIICSCLNNMSSVEDQLLDINRDSSCALSDKSKFVLINTKQGAYAGFFCI